MVVVNDMGVRLYDAGAKWKCEVVVDFDEWKGIRDLLHCCFIPLVYYVWNLCFRAKIQILASTLPSSEGIDSLIFVPFF